MTEIEKAELLDSIPGHLPQRQALRKLMAEHDQMKAALEGFLGVTTKAELNEMERVVRSTPVPDLDKRVALNAIHALQLVLS